LTGGELKGYQLDALNWMKTLFENGINGILADDMGLGKTIQTISLIGYLRQFKKIKGHHLIIAPKITLGNWLNEFRKWLPMARVVKLIATKEEREEILSDEIIPGKFDVVITSYEGVRLGHRELKRIKWSYLIID
jgi:SWI/SNF-related matrix-associated actin-dependent regulator of chromatin subfamily A member 5